MKILLYCPDNGVTRNFMPHLWMFLLQSLTPRGHEVLLIDGNTQPMSDADVVRYVLHHEIGLVGIGAMTRMVAKAYRVADAIRAAGVPVVMGGPHVTEVPSEALGRDGGQRHAGYGKGDRVARERTCPIQNQPPDRTYILPWHLFSTERGLGMDKSDDAESGLALASCQGIFHAVGWIRQESGAAGIRSRHAATGGLWRRVARLSRAKSGYPHSSLVHRDCAVPG